MCSSSVVTVTVAGILSVLPLCFKNWEMCQRLLALVIHCLLPSSLFLPSFTVTTVVLFMTLVVHSVTAAATVVESYFSCCFPSLP